MTQMPPRRGRRTGRIASLAVLALGAFAAPALATTAPDAQITSGNLFMGTTKVEVGSRANGSFGSTVGAPAGYNPRTTSGTILGFRVNQTECNWTDPSCVTVGDFFTPGTPYESWGIQVGAGSPAYNDNAGTGVAGSFTSSSTSGISGVWESSSPVSGISVKQTYSVPNYAWLINTKVELTNTTGSTINDVYFLRGLDPDNCKTEVTAVCDNNGDGIADATGNYKTHQTIVAQGSATTAALVTATQTNNSYLGLRAEGDGAKVFSQNSGFSNPTSLETLWNGGDSGYTSTAAATSFGDNGIYAVVHVPSIAPGATVTLHVQYVVKDVPQAVDIPDVPVDPDGGLIDVLGANPAGAVLQGICADPAHGTAAIESNKIRYTPTTGYSGTDSFGYSTGGPCGIVTLKVSSTPRTPAPAPATPAAPIATLLAPAAWDTPSLGSRKALGKLVQRIQLNQIGRYTFIYINPSTGKRITQVRYSRLGKRTLFKRYCAPVLVSSTAGRRVKLVTYFDPSVTSVTRSAMKLRIVLRKPDGTLVDQIS